ncbi:MAG TPA: adenylate/guanylate cyclase domain-containing protein [Burkholderiales bacterium]|jgi:adenylate cyclase
MATPRQEEDTRAGLAVFQATASRRNLRAASGLVLFAYVATHLLSHSFGLISLAAAEEARLWFVGFWRNGLVSPVMYAALVTHITLACMAVYERRTLRMPRLEATRMLLGFCIPFLLAAHYTGTQIAHAAYGQDDPYIRIAWSLWSRDFGLWPLFLVMVAWCHGCFGVHLMARHRPAYRRFFYAWFAAAWLLPVLALLGFASMAREIGWRMADPHWYAAQMARIIILNARQKEVLDWLPDAITAAFALLFAVVLLARAWRERRERLDGASIALTYPGMTVRVPRGWSVLEASRANRIAHLSLCGGRARCSTCRVQVEGLEAHCPPPSNAEARTLKRIGAGPNVRLACQLRPLGDLRVTPLLSAGRAQAAIGAPFGGAGEAQFGAERNLVILFIDLRQWTGLSQQQLPFDLVYVLEQYFAAVGEAVLACGGVPNQFVGDCVMAMFGLESGLSEACRAALKAAGEITVRLNALGARMQEEFGKALDFGIGIHAGRAAVGTVGYQETRSLTAVGDAVNTASRLQELTKRYHVRLVISEPVARGAGLAYAADALRDEQIRGRTGVLRVLPIADPLSVVLAPA